MCIRDSHDNRKNQESDCNRFAEQAHEIALICNQCGPEVILYNGTQDKSNHDRRQRELGRNQYVADDSHHKMCIRDRPSPDAGASVPAGTAVQVETVTSDTISSENKVSGKVTSDLDASVFVATSAKCTAVYVEVGDTCLLYTSRCV